MFSSSQAFGGSQGQTLVMGFGSSQGGEAGGKKRQEDNQSTLPVTIRGIEAAVAQRADEGGDLRFFGREHGMLVLVAALETVVKQSASFEFSLNDATGRIKARYFVTDQQPKDIDDMVPGRYVSLYGNVRTSPVVHFAAMGVRLIQSPDEVSYHMIESAHAALKLQKVNLEPTTPSPKKPAVATVAEPADISMEITPPKDVATPTAAAVPAPTMAAPVPAAAPAKAARLEGGALSTAIMDFLKGESREEGVGLAVVCSNLSSNTSEEVRKALDKLVADGEVFNTLDDETFAAV